MATPEPARRANPTPPATAAAPQPGDPGAATDSAIPAARHAERREVPHRVRPDCSDEMGGFPAFSITITRLALGQRGRAVEDFFKRNEGFGAQNALDGLNTVVQHIAQMLGIAALQAGKYAVSPGGEVDIHHFRNFA